MTENTTIEDLKAPLLAAIGAADLALATMTDLVANLRDRAEEARGDATNRVEESRARLTKLQDEWPDQLAELREKFTADELRKAAEGYVEAATGRYNELVARGEAALVRLRAQSNIQSSFEDASAKVEGYVEQAVELTQEVLGTVATQTREVGERAANLVGIDLPKKDEAPAPAATPAAAPAPAKKAPAAKAPAAKAPAKKAPAKTPAKKAPAKKVTQK